MAGGHFGVVIRRLERLFSNGTVAGLSEGQLVERFAARRDEAAFEALLARHGPMVLGICRQVLHDPDAVEDAFQATFLVLVRKAGTLRDRDLVGNWLFGVASRVAKRARAVETRRRAVEGKGEGVPVESLAGPGIGTEAAGEADRESRAMLHEEVARLPEKYRVPVVLCYLEGLTHEEAARRLGWPVGTVKGRLARARERLHGRLTRRGVALSSSALAVALTRSARAAVSPALAESTLRAALAVAAGRAVAAGVVAANVSTLMKGVLNAMFWNQIKTAAAVTLAAGVVTVGGGGWAYMAAGADEESPPDASQDRIIAQAREKPHGTDSATPPAPGLVSAAEIDALNQKEQVPFTGLLDRARKRKGQFDDLERLVRWSSHLLESQLDLSRTGAERGAALSAHRDRMKQLHELTQSLPQSDLSVDERLWIEFVLHELTQSLPQSDPDQPAKADFARVQRQLAERMLAAEGSGQPAMPAAPRSIETEVKPRTGGMGGGFIVNPAVEKNTRIHNAQLAPLVAAQNTIPANQNILAKLEEPISMSFANETPLEDVLKYIKSATAGPDNRDMMQIYVDPVGLSEAEKTMSSPITMDLDGIPVKTTLRLLLKQLGLDYCVKDGLVLISSVEGVQQELAEAAAALGIDPMTGVSTRARPGPSPAARAKESGSKASAGNTAPEPPPPSRPSAAPPPPEGPATPRPKTDPGMLKSEAIRKALDQPVKLAIARETPLSDVLDSIKTAARTPDGGEIPIYVDPAVSDRLRRRVEFNLEGVPLRTSLSLILSRVGLNWGIQDGLLIISDEQGLENYRRTASHFTRAFGASDSQYPSTVSSEFVARFDVPISLSFPEPTPLNEILEAIRTATQGSSDSGIPVFFGPPVSVWVGPDPFKNQSKEVGTLPVRIDVKDIPLRTCLALLLSRQEPFKVIEHGGQSYSVATSPALDGRLLDGLLVIGDPEWVKSLKIPSEFNSGMMGGMGGVGGQGMM